MSAYGISGFVDGFLKGREIRIGEKDKAEEKARRAKLDELTFEQDARAAEEHAARMGVFSRQEQDWNRSTSEYDRIKAEEAATRDAQQRAYDAAFGDGQGAIPADTAAPAGLGIAPGATPGATPVQPPVQLPFTPPANNTAAAFTGPGGMPMPAQPMMIAPEQLGPTKAAAASMVGASAGLGAIKSSGPNDRTGAMQPEARAPAPNDRAIRVPVPALQLEALIHLNGRVYDTANGKEITDPQAIKIIKDSAAQTDTPEGPGFVQGVGDQLAPNYAGHEWLQNPSGDIAELGKRSIQAARNVGDSINDAAQRGANTVNYGVNKAMGAVMGDSAPQVPYFTGNGLETKSAAQWAADAQKQKEDQTGRVKGLSDQWDAATAGSNPSTRGAAPVAATGVAPGPTVQNAELQQTAKGAMAEAASPAVTAAVESAAAKSPQAMGLKPGQAVTSAQRDRAADAMIEQYVKVGAPIVLEDMLKRGDFEGATKFQEWMDTQGAKAGMKSWAKAAFAASVGDMDTFADEVISAYNRIDYFPDGTTIVKDKSGFSRGKNGEITGAVLTFKDEETGNTFEQVFSDPNDLVRLGITLMAPEKAYEAFAAKTAEASKGMGLTPKEALDAQQADAKRIDALAMDLFKESQEAAMTKGGGAPLTYPEARAQAEAVVNGGGGAAAPGPAGPGAVPIMRRPTN